MKKITIWISVIAFIITACTKDSNPPPLQNPPIISSLRLEFPTTAGTWWKYERVDSIIKDETSKPTIYQGKKTEEIISVAGTTTFKDGRQVTILKIENTTENTLDTMYVSNTKDSICFFTRFDANLQAPKPYMWVKLPMYNARQTDPYIAIDTSLNLNGTITNKLAFLKMETYITLGGAGTTYSNQYFFQSGTGFFYTERRSNGSSHTGSLAMIHTKELMSRRLIDKKIVQ